MHQVKKNRGMRYFLIVCVLTFLLILTISEVHAENQTTQGDQSVNVEKSTKDKSSLTIMKRDIYSNIYYDDDTDNYVAEISPEPINYGSEYGILPINNNVGSDSCELDYCGNKGIYNVDFSSDSDSTKTLIFRYKSDSIAYKIGNLEFEEGRKKQLISNNRNVKGYANESKFVYPDIYGDGINIVYDYQNTLLKEEIIIESFSSLPYLELDEQKSYLRVNFEIEAITKIIEKEKSVDEKLKFVDKSKDKRWWEIFDFEVKDKVGFKDDTGYKDFFMPKAFAYDSQGNEVELAYHFEKDDGNIFVSLSVPYLWLINATYPVVIDPGVEISAQGYGEVERYNFDIGGGERYDWDADLNEIGARSFGGGDGKKVRGWTYFNVSFIPDEAIVSEVDIENWISGLILDDCPHTPAAIDIKIYKVNEESVDLTPSTEENQQDTWFALDTNTLYNTITIDDESFIGWNGTNLGSVAIDEAQDLIDGSPTPYFAISYVGSSEIFGNDCAGDISTSNKPRLTIYYSVNESSQLTWPQCNPADPCCDSRGYFRSNGFVCKSAHNATCNSINSTSCGGQAYEDRCTGTSSLCPDNNYLINYPAACDDQVCTSKSCSGSTFQPQRTCDAGICQRNDALECPNNLICANSTACILFAISSSDCKASSLFNNTLNVCYFPLEEGEAASDYIYDANGNLISGDGFIFSYNDLNQLISIRNSNGSIIANYSYNHEGKRIKKVVYSTNTTTYYLDKFVQIVNSSGVYNETYYYYYSYLAGKKDINGNIIPIVFDHLGSPSLIFLPNGSVKEVESFESFGDPINIGERYAYTGYEADIEAELLYAKARYYDPTKGQFTQPDKFTGNVYHPQSLNKYSYANNNPYTYVDPTGYYPLPAVFYNPWKFFSDAVISVKETISSWWESEENEPVRTASELTGASDVGRVVSGSAELLTYDEEVAQYLPDYPTPKDDLFKIGEGTIGLVTGFVGDVGRLAKHEGFLKPYLNQPTKSIEKAIKSLEKRINEHQEKIDKLKLTGETTRESSSLVNHWRNEIQNWREQVNILKDYLKFGGNK